MSRKVKHFTKLFAAVIAITFFVGCTPARRPIEERDRIDINQERINENNLNVENVVPDQRMPEGDMGYDNIPDNMNGDLRIEREIEGIDGVRDAVVILDNNTAYVGLESDDVNNTNTMRGLQAQVAGRVREVLPQIERVYVTSDTDRFERLKEYRQRLNNGTPARDLVNEIERLFS